MPEIIYISVWVRVELNRGFQLPVTQLENGSNKTVSQPLPTSSETKE